MEAADRWLNGVVTRARAVLLRGVREDPRLALDFLSRVDPRLHPRAALELAQKPNDTEFRVIHVTAPEEAQRLEAARERLVSVHTGLDRS